MYILLVDDDPLICANVRSKLQRLLGPAPLHCEIAQSVVDAELMIEKRLPDLVITDLNMPGISGLTLVKHIKSRYPETRVFVLSGYDDYNLVRQAFLNGADDYLLKPVEIGELRSKVLASSPTLPSGSERLSKSEWSMGKALVYIDQHIASDLTMQELAQNLAISYNHFSKLFGEQTGVSFPEYLHRRRIELSKRYLADPSAKISHIAHKVGYKSAAAFSKAFKKYEGFYPSDYRHSAALNEADEVNKPPE